MAKKDQVIVDVEQVYSKSEAFFEKNKNAVLGALTAIIVVVAGYFAYDNMYTKPLNKEASELMWKAEFYFERENWDLALDGDGNNFGFLYVIDEYGSTKSGKLANYCTGVCYMQKGEFELAIDYLKTADLNDKVVGAMAKGQIGDAYVELGDFEGSIKWYNKAISHSDNEFSAPIFLKKRAIVQKELGDFKGALAAYKTIEEDYPTSSEAADIAKDIAFAEANI